MAARNARESMLAETVREVLGLSAPVPVDADFFTDLGGNSLRAAQLVTKLRERDASTAVTVRDVYEARTVAALAERMAPAIMAAPEEKVSGTRPSAMLATAVQAVWLLATFSLAALAAARGVIDGASEMLRHVGLAISLLLSPVLFYAGVAVYTPFAIGSGATAGCALPSGAASMCGTGWCNRRSGWFRGGCWKARDFRRWRCGHWGRGSAGACTFIAG
jgi:acyl carrier protein